MAKKAKLPEPVVEVTPGQDPNGGNLLLSKRMGNALGCAALIVFIIFGELWIGTLACAVGFCIIFGLEVFYEKSRAWYKSINFYCAILCAVLAYVEYASGFLSNLFKIG